MPSLAWPRSTHRRGVEKTVGDGAEDARREERPHVAQVGDPHLLLMRSEDTRNHEIVRPRYQGQEAHPLRLVP